MESIANPAAELRGHDPRRSNARVPSAAAWLGAFGAVPFVGLAAGLFLVPDTAAGLMAFALATYGAVILSFLGGIHWGLAVASRPAAASSTSAASNSSAGVHDAAAHDGTDTGYGDTALARRLGLSVVPSLVGWGALFFVTPFALTLMAFAFAAMLWFDVRAARNGDAPHWYPRLRWPLTVIVVASLGLAAVA